MRKHILLYLCLLLVTVSVNCQVQFTVDTIVNKKDSILVTISNYRGSLKWEKSFDSKSWSDMGVKSDSFYFHPEKISFIRGSILENGCYNYSYSDILLVNFVPKLFSIKPDSVNLGDTIILQGSDLTAWDKFEVKVNDFTAKVVRLNDSVIYATVPLQLDAPIKNTSIVLLNTSATLKKPVLYKPELNSIVPAMAKIGQTVSLKGRHFCPDPSFNHVTIGFQNHADVTFASIDSLKFKVPDGIYINRLQKVVSCVAGQCDTLEIPLKLSDAWLKRNNAPGGQFGRYFGTSFSIGDTGYMGLGLGIGFDASKDFWKYDHVKDVWTKLNDFPGGARTNAFAMVIGDTAYVGCGIQNNTQQRDLWKYYLGTDTWKRVASVPGSAMPGGANFSIGGKGYMVLPQRTNNFWVYDPQTDSWIQKADFVPEDNNPYYPEIADLAFVINNKGYVLTNDGTTAEDEVWEYEPVSDIWTKKANQIDNLNMANRVVFVINNEAYLFPHYNSNVFAKYNPVNNTWARLPDPKPRGRNGGTVFVFHNVAYFGTGTYYFDSFSDFWEFDPVYLNY